MEDQISREIAPNFNLPREISVISMARKGITLENVGQHLSQQQRPIPIQAAGDLLIQQGVATIATLVTTQEEEGRRYPLEYSP